MRPRHQALAMMAVAILTISLGGCFDAPTGSSRCFDIIFGERPCPVVDRNKTLEVTRITTGEDIDPDGYILEIREDPDLSGAMWPASANGTDTYGFCCGPTGDHTVELGDVASNCVVSGDHPRVVWISYSDTAKTTFEIQCTAIP